MIFASCVPQSVVARGSVVMKISDHESHVNLGKNLVKVGDKLNILHEECPGSVVGKGMPAIEATHCEVKQKAEGVVKKVLNDEYSVVSTHGPVHEGDIVELRVSR